MGNIWGGKKWRPADMPKKQPKINQSIEELLKPLSEKNFKGNVWGSQIMNVEKETTTPIVSPSPTPTVTPTQSVTPSITPSVTPSISVTPTPTITPTPSSTPPTPLSFQQTDDSPSPDYDENASCVSRLTSPTGWLRKNASVGGTAGTSYTISVSTGGGALQYRLVNSNKLIIPSGTTWNAGTWTWRLKATQSAGPAWLILASVDICRVNSSGIAQETIGTANYTTNIPTSGVLSGTITGSAQTPSSGDYVIINFTFRNIDTSSRNTTITNDQIINSPFT